MKVVTIDAGHGINTAGKRVPQEMKRLGGTRENRLNQLIVDELFNMCYMHKCDFTLTQVNDSSGSTDTPLATRATKSNNLKADFHISIHHNAAGRIFSGGGYTLYAAKNSRGKLYLQSLDELFKKFGVPKGNRSRTMVEQNFYILTHTKAPAILVECAFMDSTTDNQYIATSDFVHSVAVALFNFLKTYV